MVQRLNKERKSVTSSGKLSDDQVMKLKQDLQITQSNLDIFSELLTELKPGEVRFHILKLVTRFSCTLSRTS